MRDRDAVWYSPLLTPRGPIVERPDEAGRCHDGHCTRRQPRRAARIGRYTKSCFGIDSAMVGLSGAARTIATVTYPLEVASRRSTIASCAESNSTYCQHVSMVAGSSGPRLVLSA